MTKTGDLRVVGYPRLHFGLLDLGRATSRAYGGLGAAIDAFPTVVEFTPRADSKVRVRGLAADHARTIRGLVMASRARLNRGFELCVTRRPEPHVGFGTETTLRLACLVAAEVGAGNGPSERLLQERSERGGTSGVGVHSFFHGGLVVDGGHRATDVPELLPSSASRPRRGVPPMLAWTPMPSGWSVALLLPSQGARVSGGAERDFFRARTPIPASEVLHGMSLVYHGILPAVSTVDFPVFKRSLVELQDTGFKRLEIEAQVHGLDEFLRHLNSREGLAAGMSSLGPLVFVVTPHRRDTVMRCLPKLMAECQAAAGRAFTVEDLGVHEFRNAGFTVEL